jgi:cell division protein FtsB
MRPNHRRPFVAYALGAVLVAGAYLCFELGRYQSGYSVVDRRRESAAYEQRLEQQQAENEELRRRLAILETSREIDKETYSVVESDLGQLQAKIQAQEEELVFYRGIVSPQDGVAGLRIQRLEVLPADGERRYMLRLVLVQAIVQSRRLAGEVKLQLAGLVDGQMRSFDLAELANENGSYDMAYEFRYFQGLEAEFTVPLGFEPERLNVEIWPKEARAERVTESFEWSAVVDAAD